MFSSFIWVVGCHCCLSRSVCFIPSQLRGGGVRLCFLPAANKSTQSPPHKSVPTQCLCSHTLQWPYTSLQSHTHPSFVPLQPPLFMPCVLMKVCPLHFIVARLQGGRVCVFVCVGFVFFSSSSMERSPAVDDELLRQTVCQPVSQMESVSVTNIFKELEGNVCASCVSAQSYKLCQACVTLFYTFEIEQRSEGGSADSLLTVQRRGRQRKKNFCWFHKMKCVIISVLSRCLLTVCLKGSMCRMWVQKLNNIFISVFSWGYNQLKIRISLQAHTQKLDLIYMYVSLYLLKFANKRDIIVQSILIHHKQSVYKRFVAPKRLSNRCLITFRNCNDSV